MDGKPIWSTRYDGAPVAHPMGTLLLGRRHGEHWGPGRVWRAGVGDPTCLQANICNFAFYPQALSAATIKKHFLFDPAQKLAAPSKEPAVQSNKPAGKLKYESKRVGIV